MTTFETSGPITAAVDIVLGDVEITTGDGSASVVEVRPSDAANRDDVKAAELTRVEFANEHLVVKAPRLRTWLPRSDGGSIAVTIELPSGSHLRATGQLADFHCHGHLGDCRIKTGMGRVQLDQVDTLSIKNGLGEIAVERVAGHADVATGSGDVRIRELADSGVVKNSNGDTWIGAAAGELRLSAANGDIAIDSAQAGVVAKSSNGDVRLGEAVRGSVVLETRLGDVEIGVRDGTAAWLDARAGAGRVDNGLDATDAPGPSDDTVEVRARTSAGNVLIRRS